LTPEPTLKPSLGLGDVSTIALLFLLADDVEDEKSPRTFGLSRRTPPGEKSSRTLRLRLRGRERLLFMALLDDMEVNPPAAWFAFQLIYRWRPIVHLLDAWLIVVVPTTRLGPPAQLEHADFAEARLRFAGVADGTLGWPNDPSLIMDRASEAISVSSKTNQLGSWR